MIAKLDTNYLIYLDANKLYGWAMSQQLPVENVKKRKRKLNEGKLIVVVHDRGDIDTPEGVEIKYCKDCDNCIYEQRWEETSDGKIYCSNCRTRLQYHETCKFCYCLNCERELSEIGNCYFCICDVCHEKLNDDGVCTECNSS